MAKGPLCPGCWRTPTRESRFGSGLPFGCHGRATAPGGLLLASRRPSRRCCCGSSAATGASRCVVGSPAAGAVPGGGQPSAGSGPAANGAAPPCEELEVGRALERTTVLEQELRSMLTRLQSLRKAAQQQEQLGRELQHAQQELRQLRHPSGRSILVPGDTPSADDSLPGWLKRDAHGSNGPRGLALRVNLELITSLRRIDGLKAANPNGSSESKK
jgi:hypothetical protein